MPRLFRVILPVTDIEEAKTFYGAGAGDARRASFTGPALL